MGVNRHLSLANTLGVYTRFRGHQGSLIAPVPPYPKWPSYQNLLAANLLLLALRWISEVSPAPGSACLRFDGAQEGLGFTTCTPLAEQPLPEDRVIRVGENTGGGGGRVCPGTPGE